MTTRLTRLVEAWVEDAIVKHSNGDKITWDVAIVATEQGPGLLFVTFMSGAILGTMIHSQAVIGNPAVITEADVDRMVSQMAEALRAERSKQLTQGQVAHANGQVVQAEAHPHPHP